MREIVLVRHGQTHQNRDRVIQGQHPRWGRLNPLGMAQARAVGEALADDFDFEQVLCSPLERAVITLSLMLCARPGVNTLPLRFDAALREIDMGSFSGQPAALWWSGATEAPEPMDFRPPGGESWNDVKARVGRYFDDVIRALPGRTLVVAHGGVIRGILAHVTGLPMAWGGKGDGISQRNACINRIQLSEDGSLASLWVDDTRHLAGLEGQGASDAGRRWDVSTGEFSRYSTD